MLIRVELRVAKGSLRRSEWTGPYKPYREWQVPAALVNSHRVRFLIILGWRARSIRTHLDDFSEADLGISASGMSLSPSMEERL